MSDRDFPGQGPGGIAGRPRPAEDKEQNREPEAGPSGEGPGAADAPSRHDPCRAFMEQLPFGVLTARPDYSVDYVNGRFREMFGYGIDEIPDIRSWFEKFAHKPVSKGMLDQLFHARTPRAQGLHRETVIAVQTRRGGRRLCQVHFVALADGRLLTTYENVAERGRVESELQYSKIDSVSILTGGLALILDGIAEGLQALLDTMQGQNAPAVRQLQAVEQEARSARELLQKIRSFTGGRVNEARPIDLKEIIRKTSTIFANTRGGITVRRKLDEKLWAVEVERIQLEKMLIHLYFHLQQVSPTSPEFHIEAENACLFAPESTLYRVKPGRYVRVSLSAGALPPSPAGRPRALRLSAMMNDPGLRDSLSMTYAQCIVQGHGGVMTLTGGEGSPSAVHILLPAAESPALGSPALREAGAPGGTILLVDDDEVLIGVIREILESAGYRVLTAFNGREALEIYEAWRGDIDLVMLDMIMPGMGGAETYRELRGMDPKVPVLIVSGYSLPDQIRDLLAQGCRGFLQKPFQIPELFEAIRRAMLRDDGKRG
ncbi:MAG: Blue-light-activated protein [Syntrophaceae bacterium PtaB.Bin038]|nr:MAG: Blue-light-activated protein [Syntrophaceae bacterium PtaB.Bin038]